MSMSVNPLGSALQQIQSMAQQAAGNTVASGSVRSSGGLSGALGADDAQGTDGAGSFASALKTSLGKISADQNNALGEAHAFEIGASNVSLNDVMVDM